MTALTSPRNTIARLGDLRNQPLAASAKVYGGALVMRNAAGFVIAGSTIVGGIGLGCAEESADNGAGAAGDVSVDYRPGYFLFANSAAADLIGQAEVGKLCYIVDDQTVAKTDGGATRSPAGVVDGLEGTRVWVRFDEAVTRAL